MNVSWKQSSAASQPTEATRKRHTSSRWSSRKRWNGGGVTEYRRSRAVVRERASPERSGHGAEGERRRDHAGERECREPEATLQRLHLVGAREQPRGPQPPRHVREDRRRDEEQQRLGAHEDRPRR